jgi:ATP-dependent RNA helicase DDX5/DBP2
MLGVGFAPQIERVKTLLGLDSSKSTKSTKSSKKSSERAPVQVGLFTATMPAAMSALTSSWLHNPKKIALKSASSGASAGRAISATVVQVVQVCAEHKKPAKLMKHLEGIKAAAASAGNRHAPKILIFANRIKTVRFVFKLVLKANFRVAQLHGERSQEEREEAIKDFKSGKVQVLVASDVAARGLDVSNLPYVVNYDFPGNLETYIHRVGRTGRLAADGHAFSFITREMAPLAGSLLGLLREHDQSVDPNLVKLAEAYEVAAKKLGLPLRNDSGDANGRTKKGVVAAEEEDNDNEDDDSVEDMFDPKKRANRPATEDILRELDMKTKAQKRKDKLIEAKQEKKKQKRELAAKDAEDEESSSDEEEEDDVYSSDSDISEDKGGVTKKKAGNNGSSAAATPAARPEFVASKKFSGARPGYVFKKGGMGVGYYVDHPPHKVLKDLARARKQIAAKYAAKPVGGNSGAGEKIKKKAAVATKAVPLLPGKMKTLKRQQQEYPFSDEEGFGGSSGSDSDDDGDGGSTKKVTTKKPSSSSPVQAVSGQKKRGALPGRLRKKLAKDRAKKAAAAGVKTSSR